MLDGSSVIKTSNTAECKCYGRGPGEENYAQTSFTNWTQAESNAAVKAWQAGTLTIKRFVNIKSYTDSGHGSPVFRDGVYNDVITIKGSTTPFTQYKPGVVLYDVFRSDDGLNDNPESTSIYAKIRLTMNDKNGLSDNPRLLAYYAEDSDPTTSSSCVNITSTFGMNASNLNIDKVIKIPGTWNNGISFHFKIYFTAGEEVGISNVDIASRASVPIYISENNNGVSIGQYSSASESNSKFECRWPAYFYGGIAQIGDGEGSLLDLVGIQVGSVVGEETSSGMTKDYDVIFDKPYSVAPVVVVGMQLSGRYATSYYMGRVSIALISVSTTGFKVRSYHVSENNNSVNIGFTWAAFGTIQ